MAALQRFGNSLTAGNEIVRNFEGEFQHSVCLYDETLRDGEQSPGVCFSRADKLKITEELLAAGVRHLTLGFPASSPEELRIVCELNRFSEDQAETWCVSRMRAFDLEAVHKAGVSNVTLFLPGSDIHLERKLGISLDEALRVLDSHIAIALRLGLRVRFALEDASRTPVARIERFALAAMNAGASMLTLADTCGVLTPYSTEQLFSHIRTLHPGIPLVAHCHNDLGLATANSIAAAKGGANFLQGALGGLGERAGNAPLEEIAVILCLKYGAETQVNLQDLCTLAAVVLSMTDEEIPANKPLLGSRVFAHESGIHVHGLLRDLATYEPFPPELIGRSHEIRYGKHSGESNIEYVLSRNDLQLSSQATRHLLARIQERASAGELVTEITVLDEARRVMSGD